MARDVRVAAGSTTPRGADSRLFESCVADADMRLVRRAVIPIPYVLWRMLLPLTSRAREAFVCMTVAGALAGCGGGSALRLSQAAFEARANAACKEANDEIQALPAAKVASFSELARSAAELVPIADRLARKLHAVIPPLAYQPQWTKLLADLDSTTTLLSKMRSAAQSANWPEVQMLSKEIDSKNANSIATELGLSDCARNVQPGGQ